MAVPTTPQGMEHMYGAQCDPRFLTVTEAFLHHASTKPFSIAARDVSKPKRPVQITYGDLSQRSARLARKLHRLGVAPGSRVPLVVKRGIDMLVGIMAILTCGAQYVPLDGGVVPESTLRFVTEQAGGSTCTVLALKSTSHRLEQCNVANVVCIDDGDQVEEEQDERPKSPLVNMAKPDHGCYVIYTSGTTGSPKGVDVSHRNVCNLVCLSPGNLGIVEGTRVGQVLNISFDMAAWEMLGCLCNGGTLILRGSDWRRALKKIDVLICTPSILSKFEPKEFPQIKTVATAGEPSSQPLADKWTGAGKTYYNCCGPTETTIVNTMHLHTTGQPLSIGKPTPNNNVYILNEEMQPVFDEPGVMWAGGWGVSKGYIDLPEKTAEKYLPDPFLGDGSMMYNTGDIGQWNEDGSIHILGRQDDQVKFKGFRVELDGVTASLNSCTGVNRSTVLLIADALHAFVAPADCDINKIKTHMQYCQPYYAVPSYFHLMDSLPLTANGKIDKKILRETVIADITVDKVPEIVARPRRAVHHVRQPSEISSIDGSSEKDGLYSASTWSGTDERTDISRTDSNTSSSQDDSASSSPVDASEISTPLATEQLTKVTLLPEVAEVKGTKQTDEEKNITITTESVSPTPADDSRASPLGAEMFNEKVEIVEQPMIVEHLDLPEKPQPAIVTVRQPNDTSMEGPHPKSVYDSSGWSDSDDNAHYDLEAAVPEKLLGKRARGLRYRVMIVYRRLFSLVGILNIAATIAIILTGIDRNWVGNLTAINLVLGVLVRQEFVINALYTITCSVPKTWPLAIRKRCAKIYHLGGVHSGAGVAAALWLLANNLGDVVCNATGQCSGSWGNQSIPATVVSWLLTSGFIAMLTMAYPTIRKKYHDHFERTHRFLGWTMLGLFWIQVVLTVNDSRGENTLGEAVLRSPPIWLLVVATLSIASSWFWLKKVPVEAEVLSDHAVRLHFDYTVPVNGSFTRLSRKPLVEWHSFATIPAPQPENGRPPGYSLVVSNAGDWTKSTIQGRPTHLWVRGVPTCGVMRIATLFNSVVVIGTGSGIGPLLGHIQSPSCRTQLIWSTSKPEKTFGDEMVRTIKKKIPGAVIHDTKVLGRPDLVKMGYNMAKGFGAEAVIIIANEKITKKVVYGLETRGVPAYGAIWDS